MLGKEIRKNCPFLYFQPYKYFCIRHGIKSMACSIKEWCMQFTENVEIIVTKEPPISKSLSGIAHQYHRPKKQPFKEIQFELKWFQNNGAKDISRKASTHQRHVLHDHLLWQDLKIHLVNKWCASVSAYVYAQDLSFTKILTEKKYNKWGRSWGRSII